MMEICSIPERTARSMKPSSSITASSTLWPRRSISRAARRVFWLLPATRRALRSPLLGIFLPERRTSFIFTRVLMAPVWMVTSSPLISTTSAGVFISRRVTTSPTFRGRGRV